jgi:hypothetical protein
MLVQVVHVFDDSSFHRARHRDVVEHRQVLHILAQPDAAGMRTDWHVERRRQQDDGEVLFTPPRRQLSIWQKSIALA